MTTAQSDLIKALNEALADEYAQFVEMATQASITSGTEALYLKPFFEKQAEGALAHAAALRERIFFLGGVPTTQVGSARVHKTAQEALSAGVAQHEKLAEGYRALLNLVQRHKGKDGDILYEAIEEILEGEQNDLEAFERLSGQVGN